jgi:hypothetical protein
MFKSASNSEQFMTRVGRYSDRISRRGFLSDKLPGAAETNALQEQYLLAMANIDRVETELQDINNRIRYARTNRRGMDRLRALQAKRELLKGQSERAHQECRNARLALIEIRRSTVAVAFMAAAMRVLPVETVSRIWEEVHAVKESTSE